MAPLFPTKSIDSPVAYFLSIFQGFSMSTTQIGCCVRLYVAYPVQTLRLKVAPGNQRRRCRTKRGRDSTVPYSLGQVLRRSLENNGRR